MDITITTREAAAALGVSIRTVQRWAATGRLQAAKIGRRWVITLDAAAVAAYKPASVDKARDLIEARAILPTSRPGMYTAVSSCGTVTYLVHRCGCTCPAGIKGRPCYHRAAVEIITATAAARQAA